MFAVSVWPTCAVPLIVGATVSTGALSPETISSVLAEFAVALPTVLVAITLQLTLLFMSSGVKVYL